MKNLLEFSTGQFMNIVFQINNKIQNIYIIYEQYEQFIN